MALDGVGQTSTVPSFLTAVVLFLVLLVAEGAPVQVAGALRTHAPVPGASHAALAAPPDVPVRPVAGPALPHAAAPVRPPPAPRPCPRPQAPPVVPARRVDVAAAPLLTLDMAPPPPRAAGLAPDLRGGTVRPVLVRDGAVAGRVAARARNAEVLPRRSLAEGRPLAPVVAGPVEAAPCRPAGIRRVGASRRPQAHAACHVLGPACVRPPRPAVNALHGRPCRDAPAPPCSGCVGPRLARSRRPRVAPALRATPVGLAGRTARTPRPDGTPRRPACLGRPLAHARDTPRLAAPPASHPLPRPPALETSGEGRRRGRRPPPAYVVPAAARQVAEGRALSRVGPRSRPPRGGRALPRRAAHGPLADVLDGVAQGVPPATAARLPVRLPGALPLLRRPHTSRRGPQLGGDVVLGAPLLHGPPRRTVLNLTSSGASGAARSNAYSRGAGQAVDRGG